MHSIVQLNLSLTLREPKALLKFLLHNLFFYRVFLKSGDDAKVVDTLFLKLQLKKPLPVVSKILKIVLTN